MIGAVIRNEWLKTVHRLAFWVGFLLFTGIWTVTYIDTHLRARIDPDRTFALPDAWDDLLTDDVEPVFIFGAVMLILLIGNEFTWRTARQNVIDGLSKEQWFAGKALLLPFMLVAFYVVGRLLPGVIIASLGTGGGEAASAGVRWAALGGVSLGVLGAMSLAFFIVMAVRSAGAAMAVWLLWFAVVENLIAGGLVRLSASLEPVVEFFPSHVFPALFRWIQYDPVAFRAAVERAVANNRTPPEIWDLNVLVLAALAWIAVLIGGAYVWFRKRDL